MNVDDEKTNVISDTGSLPSITKSGELKAVHDLGDMGFSMEVVLEAIDEVKTSDNQTLLNHILSKGIS